MDYGLAVAIPLHGHWSVENCVAIYLGGRGWGAGGALEYSTSEVDSPFLGFSIRMVNAKN